MNHTTQEFLKIIGERIKLYRVYSGISQNELEEKTGVSKRTITRLESGNSVQMDNLIKILSALNLDENIKLLIPDQSIRPSAFLLNKKVNQRVSRKNKKENDFKWGDQE